jgi:hypothetical protein
MLLGELRSAIRIAEMLGQRLIGVDQRLSGFAFKSRLQCFSLDSPTSAAPIALLDAAAVRSYGPG